ncbi:hypothetical protein [Neisseria iguanae]|uniref:Uncharacterized protein n=1 Tax=Neisseria iguanae TaxID=90242 RepID=A0A2P7TYV5_9NEIS|nr:hypothetical protein [Neisseria iguanae]PSJ79910.1 hypothetical protein C7N83_09485 [Neisseria iguanae]
METSRTKTNGKSVSNTQIADQGSFVGLRGSDPIGHSGNQMMWQWEQEARTASDRRNSKDNGTLREQWRARKQRREPYISFGQNR